jgi:hypothetical protein
MRDRIMLQSAERVPVVEAHRRGRSLIVYCPFCCKRHFHGDAGKRDPGDHGHRIAHCDAGGLGYLLVEHSQSGVIKR